MNAEKDAHDGQHPHPCGPCSFVRARRDDNAEKDAVSHGPDNPCEPKCHGWGIGCPCNPRSAENGLRKRLRPYLPNRSKTLALVSLSDRRPFRAYWPLTLVQIIGGRTWSLSFVRYQTPEPCLIPPAERDCNGYALGSSCECASSADCPASRVIPPAEGDGDGAA